jgi:hypothetical protein
MSDLTYYEILNVEKTALQKDIKKSFNKLTKQHHPDKAGGNTEIFKKIAEAYSTLSDKDKRKKYDMMLKHGSNNLIGGITEMFHEDNLNEGIHKAMSSVNNAFSQPFFTKSYNMTIDNMSDSDSDDCNMFGLPGMPTMFELQNLPDLSNLPGMQNMPDLNNIIRQAHKQTRAHMKKQYKQGHNNPPTVSSFSKQTVSSVDEMGKDISTVKTKITIHDNTLESHDELIINGSVTRPQRVTNNPNKSKKKKPTSFNCL